MKLRQTKDWHRGRLEGLLEARERIIGVYEIMKKHDASEEAMAHMKEAIIVLSESMGGALDDAAADGVDTDEAEWDVYRD